MSTGMETCALCPRLCRSACPVATATQREAATPTALAGAVVAWRHGHLARAVAAEIVALCTDCGACESFCHIHQPLPALLREARLELLPEPLLAVLPKIVGDGAIVAVECDDRRWGSALGRRLGVPVASWPVPAGLGAGSIGRPSFTARAQALVAAVAGRRVIVADGASAGALTAAGIAHEWLHEVLPSLGSFGSSCVGAGATPAPLACCGAGGPLAGHHPDEATRVAHRFAAHTGSDGVRIADARCRAHLRRAGHPATDAVDALLDAASPSGS